MSFIAIVLAAAISTITVGAAAQNSPAPAKSGMMDMAMMQSCPMTIPDAAIAVNDSVDGIHVAFSTKSGDVAELRRRVEGMAQMHNDASSGTMMSGNMMAGKMIPFTLKYEETSDGARLTLTPKDPAQLPELRTQVRAHAEQMQKGDCSMMQSMMKGMPDSMMGNMKKSESATKDAPKPEPDHSTHH
jgi:hypothetical protein